MLVEAQGAGAEEDSGRFAAALEEARAAGLLREAVVARSQAERNVLWAIRDDVGQLMRLAPVLAFDVSLPIAAMEGYVRTVREGLARSHLRGARSDREPPVWVVASAASTTARASRT